MFPRRCVFYFLCGLLGLSASPLSADDNPVTEARLADVGFGGTFKIGKWSPLTVHVTTSRPCSVSLTVESPDPDGNRTILPGTPQQLTTPGTHRLTTLFRGGRLDAALRVRVHSNAGEAEWTRIVDTHTIPAAEQSIFLVGIVGPTDRTELPAFRDQPGSPPLQFVRISPDELPHSPRGFESLDALLVLSGYDWEAEATQAALGWVRTGGHLLLAVGAGRDEYLASPLGEALAEVVPVGAAITHRDLHGLESYAERPEVVEVTRPFPAGVRLDTVPGLTLVSVLSGPLIVRVPYAFGRMTICGTDLDRPPLANWPALPVVLRKLLIGKTSAPIATTDGAGPLAQSGISELATQVHVVQSRFPSVQRSSSWTVLGLMLAYLVIVGPVDYMLVHHVLRRPRWTWATFPLWVAGAGALAAWAGRETNGEAFLTNQTDVLDVDAASGLVQSHSWVTVYSPETRRYKISARPESWCSTTTDIEPLRLSWSAAPENVFGGLYRKQGFRLNPPAYRYAPTADGLENYPVALWSTGNLTASWSADGAALVTSNLQVRDGQVTGSIQHHLPAPLEDWLLAYNGRVYHPDFDLRTGRARPLAPGVAWPPNNAAWRQLAQRRLSGFLTGAVTVEVEDRSPSNTGPTYRQDRSRYNPLAEEADDPIDEIIRMVTFHEQAGGQDYTGLTNSALRKLDFSDLLDLDQAVLFGRLAQPATRFTVNGEPIEPVRQTTFIRAILPVRSGSIGPSEPEP